MENSKSFSRKLLSNFIIAFQPVKEACNDTESFQALMFELGWEFDSIPLAEINDIKTEINAIIDIFENLANDPEEKEIIELIYKFGSFYSKFNLFAQNIVSSASYPNINDFGSSFLTSFKDQILDFIVIGILKREFSTLYNLLVFLKIIEFEFINEDISNSGRPSYVNSKINYFKLKNLVTDPASLIQTSLDWNNSLDFFESVLPCFINILSSLSIPCVFYRTDTSSLNRLRSAFNNYSIYSHGLRIHLLSIKFLNEYKSLYLNILPVLGSNVANTGFIIELEVPSELDLEMQIGNNVNLQANLNSNLDFSIAALITPSEMDFKYPFSNNSNIPSTGLNMDIVYSPNFPKLLLGSVDNTRLELNGYSFGFVVQYTNNFELILHSELTGLVLTIVAGDSDGFIKKIFGSEPKSIKLPLGVKWSSLHGISFKGGGGFEIALSPNISIGPIKIVNAILAIKAISDQDEIKNEIAASVSGKLGPISFLVENIGIFLNLQTNGGNLGKFGIGFGFKPPNGIAISVKAKAIEGGGYLFLDYDKGRYVGAVELRIAKFTLSVIAIITTKAPDGSEGFSLLFLINVTFSPSIPLTFGFSLSGIGGMIGVNRSLEPDALRIGVKTGAINHIVFPVNVIENITEIIANLESFFPVEHKRYTFGIFFLLNWGVGTPLVRIKFGVILSVPDPVRLAIIGDLNMILPTKESPVLQLNVAFAGIIDFDAKYLTFDATIYNSKLLTFSLYGDMAVRVFWGEHREILMSVGGFHPKYNAPAYLKLPAKMDRLTISLIDKEYDDLKLSIKLQTYFAITSNTVQFGTRLDLDVRITVIQILGYFGFDVLFQFNPFKFYSNVYAGLAILYKGEPILSISMNFALDGPGPWHAVGDAEFKILGFKKTAHIDKVFGDAPDTTEPTVLIEPKILEALTSNKSISSESPFDKESYIQLYDNSGDDILLDPLGSLVVSQNIAPLGINLEKLGGSKLGDAGKYDIHEVKVNGVIQNLKTNKENFAPAQFRNMNDEDKISSASFEFLKSGVKIESEDQLIEGFVVKPLNYEMIVIDEVKRYTKPVSDNDRHFIKPLVKGGIISENALSKKAGVNGIVPALRVSQEKFKAVSKDSLDDLTTPISKDSLAEAYDTIEYNLQSNYSPYSISPTLTLPTD